MPKQELNPCPKVSVVLPMYNADAYVGQAIESILNQTLTNLELIIINDASTDDSLQIATKFAEEDARVHVVDLEQNSGIAQALNTGLSLARGEYVARMDADDISAPERLEKQLNFMDNNPECGVCGSWIKAFNETKETVAVCETKLDHDSIKAQLLFSCALMHPTVVFRKTILTDDSIYESDYIPAEDYRLWSVLASKTKLANVQEVLLDYRIHGDSTSQKESTKQKLQAQRVRANILKELDLVPTVAQTKIHNAISSWDKLTLLENEDEVNEWLETLINKNISTEYTSVESMQAKVDSIKNRMKIIDNSYVIYMLRTYIPAFRYFDQEKSLVFMQKTSMFLPKSLIKRILWR